MRLKLNLIAAVSENRGIGINGGLPWRLKQELSFFSRITKMTADPTRKNAVIMGRKTWDSIPGDRKPLAGRVNFVLTRQNLDLGQDVIVCSSFEDVLEKLRSPSLADEIETAWIIGGSSLYKVAMESQSCQRIYLTSIMKTFECDTFLPAIDASKFTLVTDPNVPEGIQEENGLCYKYSVYEKLSS